MLPTAPSQSSLYDAKGLNIAIGKQVADSTAVVVARRADKTAFPTAKINNLTYTIRIAIAVLISVKNLSFNPLALELVIYSLAYHLCKM